MKLLKSIRLILVIILLCMVIWSKLANGQSITDDLINSDDFKVIPVGEVQEFNRYSSDGVRLSIDANLQDKGLLLPNGQPRDADSLLQLTKYGYGVTVTKKGLLLLHKFDTSDPYGGKLGARIKVRFMDGYIPFDKGTVYHMTTVYVADSNGRLFFVGNHKNRTTSNLYGDPDLVMSSENYHPSSNNSPFKFTMDDTPGAKVDRFDPYATPVYTTYQNFGWLKGSTDWLARLSDAGALAKLPLSADKPQSGNDFLGGLLSGVTDIFRWVGDGIARIFIPSKDRFEQLLKGTRIYARFNIWGEHDENLYFFNFEWYGVHNLQGAIPPNLLKTVKQFFTFAAVVGMSTIIYNPFKLFSGGGDSGASDKSDEKGGK